MLFATAAVIAVIYQAVAISFYSSFVINVVFKVAWMVVWLKCVCINIFIDTLIFLKSLYVLNYASQFSNIIVSFHAWYKPNLVILCYLYIAWFSWIIWWDFLRLCLWISSVQSLSCVQLFATPWTAACQASLSCTNSPSSLKLMSIELVMQSNHLVLMNVHE